MGALPGTIDFPSQPCRFWLGLSRFTSQTRRKPAASDRHRARAVRVLLGFLVNLTGQATTSSRADQDPPRRIESVHRPSAASTRASTVEHREVPRTSGRAWRRRCSRECGFSSRTKEEVMRRTSVGLLAALLGAILCEPVHASSQSSAGASSTAITAAQGDYVATPAGWYHRSCIHEIPAGARVDRRHGLVTRRDGSTYQLPTCLYPPRGGRLGAACVLRRTTAGWNMYG